MEVIQTEHIDQLYEVFELNRNYLRLYINGIDRLETREDVCRRWGTLRDDSLPLGIWLKEGQMIGRCRLTRNKQEDLADIGYWLSESYQGQGVMTAAVAVCMQFAFEQWNVQRMEIHCGENNFKSRAIPERLGFVNEGIASNQPFVEVNGHMVTSLVYSKSNPMRKQNQCASNVDNLE